MTDARARRIRWGDERGLLGKLALIIVLAVVLVVIAAVEAGSILYTRVRVEAVATAGAAAAAATFQTTGDAGDARDAALNLIRDRDEDARLTRFAVTPGGRVTVTVKKMASTFLLHRIGALDQWAVVRATERAGPPG
jgi:Flp pilus assembly protein TadG